MVSGTSAPQVYAIHGLRILSDIPLGEVAHEGAHDLAINWGRHGAQSAHAERRVLADASWDTGHGYRHVESTEGFRLQFRNTCDVCVSPDRRSLTVHLAPGADPEMISLLLEGNILATLLLLAGESVLHASAVAFGDKAIAFAGGSGAGKSTLAALCCAAGATFLTDDLLRFRSDGDEYWCFNGGCEVRLRSGAAKLAALFPDRPSRATVDGRLAIRLRRSSGRSPCLAAVVIPVQMQSTRPVMTRLAPLDAWSALMQAPRVLGVRDRSLRRTAFETCRRLAETVPVYRAKVPAGPPYQPSIAIDLLSGIGLT